MRAIKAKLSKYQTVDAFVQGWGSYYYAGGILLPTKKAEDVGADVSFHIQIATGETVLRGEGTVQEIKTNSSGETAGLVLRFTRLDARSKEIVQQALARKRDARQTGAEAAVEEGAPAPTALSDLADALDETFDAIFTGAFTAIDPAMVAAKRRAASDAPGDRVESAPNGLDTGVYAERSTSASRDEEVTASSPVADEPPDAGSEPTEGDAVAARAEVADAAAASGDAVTGAASDAALALGDATTATAPRSRGFFGDDPATRESEQTPAAGLTPVPRPRAFASAAERTAASRASTLDTVNDVLSRLGIARGPHEPPHPDALSSRPIRPVGRDIDPHRGDADATPVMRAPEPLPLTEGSGMIAIGAFGGGAPADPGGFRATPAMPVENRSSVSTPSLFVGRPPSSLGFDAEPASPDAAPAEDWHAQAPVEDVASDPTPVAGEADDAAPAPVAAPIDDARPMLTADIGARAEAVSAQAPASRPPTASTALVAPPPPPGLFGRLLAWLRRLFGGS